ncbi:peroxidase family protein, partial [Roseateles sp. GG27B]
VRLAPEKDWAVNDPAAFSATVGKLQGVQEKFNNNNNSSSKAAGGRKVSMADLIVLAGAAGIEQAAKAGGLSVKVPFTPGRTDATQAQTDVASFAFLEPKSDGFRNYYAAE